MKAIERVVLRYLLPGAFGLALAWGLSRVIPAPWAAVTWHGGVLVLIVLNNVFVAKRPWYAIWDERFDRPRRCGSGENTQ